MKRMMLMIVSLSVCLPVVTAQEPEWGMGPDGPYEVVASCDAMDIDVPWHLAMVEEIHKLGGQLLCSVHSDEVTYAQKVDGEVAWEMQFDSALVSLYFYKIDDALRIRTVERQPGDDSGPLIRTLKPFDTYKRAESILCNHFMCIEETTGDTFIVGSDPRFDGLSFGIENYDKGTSMECKVQVYNLVVNH